VTLNLAQRPFANLRPLRRLAIAMWVVGGLASVLAIWLFIAYASRSSAKRAELARLEDSAAAESQRINGLESELERADLEGQNLEVEYLNDRIAERTFAWSELFDDLAEVLPWNVRILSLSPLSIAPGRRGAQAPQPGERTFALRLAGAARDGEALLNFVDRLFAHGSFSDPNLEQERRQGGEELRFSLTVNYRPRAVALSGQTLPTSSSAAPAPPPAGVATGAPAPAVAGGAAPATAAAIGGAPIEPTSAPGAAQPRGQAPPPAADAATMAAPPGARRGWAGVDAGSATTAPLPAPAALVGGYPAAPPVPLAPATSSAEGIR
jgi:Tfp pilus assembly protein PilN